MDLSRGFSTRRQAGWPVRRALGVEPADFRSNRGAARPAAAPIRASGPNCAGARGALRPSKRANTSDWRLSSRSCSGRIGHLGSPPPQNAPGHLHMQIRDGIVEAIGNTPLIKLRRVSEETGCTILGKAEFMNPGQSVKDRPAREIILQAEKR